MQSARVRVCVCVFVCACLRQLWRNIGEQRQMCRRMVLEGGGQGLQVMSSTSCMRFRLVDKRWAGTSDNFQPLPTGKSFVSRLLAASSLPPFYPLFFFSLPPTPNLFLEEKKKGRKTPERTNNKKKNPNLPHPSFFLSCQAATQSSAQVSQATALCCCLIIGG